MEEKILVIGASGQIGSELVIALQKKYGEDSVIASDIHSASIHKGHKKYIQLDVTIKNHLEEILTENKITQVYHLAAMLSATGESKPILAWRLNVESLVYLLNFAAKNKQLKRIFWPSSIAVFGMKDRSVKANQHIDLLPETIYGISKMSGEHWCRYYNMKYDVDVRSIRLPGIISWKQKPGGGTTDYAIEIFHHALKKGKYTSFIDKEIELPMLYMDDTVQAIIQLMDKDKQRLTGGLSYNLDGVILSPKILEEAISKIINGFSVDYDLDFRNDIAKTWPASVDDSLARKEWDFKYQTNLEQMVSKMLDNLKRNPQLLTN